MKVAEMNTKMKTDVVLEEKPLFYFNICDIYTTSQNFQGQFLQFKISWTNQDIPFKWKSNVYKPIKYIS